MMAQPNSSAMQCFDLAHQSVRELNRYLHDPATIALSPSVEVLHPNGAHAIAAGVRGPLQIMVRGHVGYYCAGMNQEADIIIEGNAGVGVAENLMSGSVLVQGDASQSAGATAHGGFLHIKGNASARCGISMKGVDIVVEGSVGHLSAFMAQAGSLTVLGDAGDALGDSIYEALLFVRGKVASLGADCIEQAMDDATKAVLYRQLERAGLAQVVDIGEFRRYGSARTLYHFHVDHAGNY